MSFDTILIANRGEIALRILRCARAMGYRCVTIHTSGDALAAHVRLADRAAEVPSYLDGPAIVAAALRMGAGALHPGYGFLSENAGFASDCAAAGIVFIGPTPDAIALMGDKGAAKAAALAAGLPCLPGYGGADQSAARLLAEGARIGLPLMVKAAFGGGGKGMRLVTDLALLPEAIDRARSEALKAFGAGDLILERALLAPRHVEVQVFGDTHGHVVHLGERDCSVQRRHQKLIEEAPSPAVTPALRARMGAAAVDLARRCGYVGAGTVEFLLIGQEFWFLEMNTRLQVEHPVTEAITGLDLVDWQIRVARGEALPWTQDQITLSGHAIEVRLCAEDPADGFLPQTGVIAHWQPGVGLRVDHALAEGDEVGAGFDPMLAKLIAHGADRDEARRRLITGLEDTKLLGLRSNRRFLAAALRHPVFASGGATTAFLTEDFAADPSLSALPPGPALLAVAVLVLAGAPAPRFGFSTGPAPVLRRRFDCDGDAQTVRLTLGPGARAQIVGGPLVEVLARDARALSLRIDGIRQEMPFAVAGQTLFLGEHALRDITLDPVARRGAAQGSGQIKAPMAGAVIALHVSNGDHVGAGQVLAVIEAMKMEHPLRAPRAGRVADLTIAQGAQVKARQILMTLEPEAT